MYDQHLQITRSGSAWRVANPYRGQVRTEPAPGRGRDWLIVVPAAVIVGVPCALLISNPAAGLLVGVLAVIVAIAAAEYLFKQRTDEHRSQQIRQEEAWTATLGEPWYARADFADSELRALADRAVDAASTVTASDAFGQGLLGPVDPLASDLHIAVWDCLHTLADLDRRAASWRQARTQIEGHHRDDYLELAEKVREELIDDAGEATEAVEALEAIAEGTDNLDSRLAATEIDAALEGTLDGRPLPISDVPLLRVAAQVESANDVIDANGIGPLPPPHEMPPAPPARGLEQG